MRAVSRLLGSYAAIGGEQQRETLREQRAADEEHRGDGDLRRDDQPARACAGGPEALADRRRAVLSERAREPHAPRHARGQQANRERNDERQRGHDREHAPIDRRRDRRAGSPRAGARAADAGAPRSSARPSVPPMAASVIVSTNSWRASRPEPAPIADRMAISRRRAVACASCRFTTVPIAAANSRPPAASRIQSAGLTSRTTQSSSGTAVMLGPTPGP